MYDIIKVIIIVSENVGYSNEACNSGGRAVCMCHPTQYARGIGVRAGDSLPERPLQASAGKDRQCCGEDRKLSLGI